MSIKIDLTIIVFLLLFCITSQIKIYLILMLFACIHELGHLCVGLILGFKPLELQISPVGMRVEFKPKWEEYNKKIGKGNTLAIKRGIISLAGPLTNFIIICISIMLMKLNKNLSMSELYTTIIYANFLIGIFNLIPIYPLDGGRIIKEILHIVVGLKKAYQYTYKISKITVIILTAMSSIAILYIQNISIVIILAYLWWLVLLERKRYQQKKWIYSKAIEQNDRIMQKKLANNEKT